VKILEGYTGEQAASGGRVKEKHKVNDCSNLSREERAISVARIEHGTRGRFEAN